MSWTASRFWEMATAQLTKRKRVSSIPSRARHFLRCQAERENRAADAYVLVTTERRPSRSTAATVGHSVGRLFWRLHRIK